MDNKLLEIKIALTATFAALGEVFGWKGIMLLLVALCMFLDYISGTLAAKKNGEWSSKVAREGLFHKGGIILVTSCALIADALFALAIPDIPLFGRNSGVFLPLVLAWYIITELGSVFENAAGMGAPVPKWFKNAIRAAGTIVERAGEGDDDDAP